MDGGRRGAADRSPADCRSPPSSRRTPRCLAVISPRTIPTFTTTSRSSIPRPRRQKYNIAPRYAIEKAAAHASTVFSTVSEVTAYEAQKLLGREADVIMPNGLNIQRFAAPHEFQYLHQRYKERIHEFVMGHFFPSYSFDLDNTLYLFTSGRYEYRNKGMDLYIEALAALNQRLKEMPNPPTIVAFIITRAQTKNINVGVLQNQSMFDELRNTCTEAQRADGQPAVSSRPPRDACRPLANCCRMIRRCGSSGRSTPGGRIASR